MDSKTVVTLTANDGQTVQFVEGGDLKQGGMKDVYFAPDRKYVVAFYRKPLEDKPRERLERIVGVYVKQMFERNDGEQYRELYRWPERIVEHAGRTGIVVPLYDKKFFFSPGSSLEGVEKEGMWFTSAKNFNKFVPEKERGDLMGYLQASLSLCRAVKRLHAHGLAHSDLSFKNCLLDPVDGVACIIDIDGLVVPNFFPPEVYGTPDFIAPEVVMTSGLDKEDPAKKLPCRETDLHALPVLVYSYLFHRHPLRGSKVWDWEDDVRQESLEMGEKALFIEHPTDATNRKKIEKGDESYLPWIDTQKLPFTIMGPHLKELFLSAFVENLRNPPMRPTADDWEDAILRTRDLLVRCANAKCPKGWYVFDNSSKAVCPYCGAPYPHPSVPFLEFSSTRNGRDFRPDKHWFAVEQWKRLYRWHATRSFVPRLGMTEDEEKPLGYFQFHNGEWFFTNTAPYPVVVCGKGEEVAPGQPVKLKHLMQLILAPGADGRKALVRIVNAG